MKPPWMFPRVVPSVEVFKPFPGDMSIDLGCGNVAVAEHHLHRTQIGPPFQQMRGEGMSQGMGGEGFLDSRQLCISLETIPEGLPAHPFPGPVDKKIG